MISHQFVVAFQRVRVSDVPPHFPHPKPQVSFFPCQDNLIRQRIQKVGGLHRKSPAKRKKRE